jgi:hypothetical protein
MKAVVMACKGLLQDVEIYEQSNRPGPDRTSLPDIKSRLGGSLNVLVTAVRNHIIAGGVSPPGIVDAAASEVTGNVVTMVRALHINAATAKQASNGQVILSPIDESNSSTGYGSDIQTAYENRSNGSTPYNNSPARSRRTSLQSNGVPSRPNAMSPPSSLSRNQVPVYDIENLKVSIYLIVINGQCIILILILISLY